MRRFFLFILISGVLTFTINSQTLLLEENFSYTAGENLTAHGWTAHSSAGTNPITVNDGGLTFAGYPSSNIGNAALISSSSGEDVNRSFVSQNSGSVYLSFLIYVTTATTTAGEYNVHFNNTSPFYGRFFIKRSGSDVAFGISKQAAREDATFTGFNYLLNTTYCIVIKYTFNPDENDDLVDLFVFSSNIPEVEPSPTVSHPVEATTDASSLSAVSIRQGSIANYFILDGIRVSDSWDQAPLPVELTSFEAEYVNNSVQLNWETATEVNNFGFDIERKYQVSSSENQDWEKIDFVLGHGTTNSPKYYSYIDEDLPNADKLFYRLKQIDNDGTYAYSKTVEIDLSDVTSVDEENMQYEFALEQNYPNPFNPVTTINFTIPNVVGAKFASTTNAVLKVYNLLGQEIRTLVNEVKQAGSYQIQFDASDLPSGIYFYTLTYGNNIQTRKLALLK